MGDLPLFPLIGHLLEDWDRPDCPQCGSPISAYTQTGTYTILSCSTCPTRIARWPNGDGRIEVWHRDRWVDFGY